LSLGKNNNIPNLQKKKFIIQSTVHLFSLIATRQAAMAFRVAKISLFPAQATR
jgi:hypothetical protein